MTSDVYPQMLRMRLVETGAHTFSNTEIDTPVLAGPSQYYIMNVLGIYYEILLGDGAQIVTVKETGGAMQITKDEETALLANDNPDVIFFGSVKLQALTSGAVAYNPQFVDLSDGRGNGILIADKSIWLAVQGDGDMAGVVTTNVWIKYTLRKVSANELLDMLQED